MFRQSFLASMVVTLATCLVMTPLAAQGPRPAPDDIARAVDSLASRVVASGVSPAFGVAVVMDGRTIFSKAYGWVDATNRIPAERADVLVPRVDQQVVHRLRRITARASGHHRPVGADRDAPSGRAVAAGCRPEPAHARELPLPYTAHHDNGPLVQSAAFTGSDP